MPYPALVFSLQRLNTTFSKLLCDLLHLGPDAEQILPRKHANLLIRSATLHQRLYQTRELGHVFEALGHACRATEVAASTNALSATHLDNVHEMVNDIMDRCRIGALRVQEGAFEDGHDNAAVPFD
jgi:hypothetical protein